MDVRLRSARFEHRRLFDELLEPCMARAQYNNTSGMSAPVFSPRVVGLTFS